MADTVTIAKVEYQRLLELIGVVEEAIEYVDDHIETNRYECLDYCSQIRKALNKMRGLLTLTSQ
jgi:hypothetical protein